MRYRNDACVEAISRCGGVASYREKVPCGPRVLGIHQKLASGILLTKDPSKEIPHEQLVEE